MAMSIRVAVCDQKLFMNTWSICPSRFQKLACRIVEAYPGCELPRGGWLWREGEEEAWQETQIRVLETLLGQAAMGLVLMYRREDFEDMLAVGGASLFVLSDEVLWDGRPPLGRRYWVFLRGRDDIRSLIASTAWEAQDTYVLFFDKADKGAIPRFMKGKWAETDRFLCIEVYRDFPHWLVVSNRYSGMALQELLTKLFG